MKVHYKIRHTLSICVFCAVFLLWDRNTADSFSILCKSFQQRNVHPSLNQRTSVPPRRNYVHQSFSGSRLPSSLSMFLPPGEGNNNKAAEFRELTSAIFTFVGITLFFISPLGGLFFALFNSFLAFIILLPIGAFTVLNVWQYFNTVTGSCPTCGVGVKVLKDESPTICLNCGSIIQAKDGQIYLASTNNNEMRDVSSPASIFSSWMNEFGSGRIVDSEARKQSRSTVIDVDVKEIDD